MDRNDQFFASAVGGTFIALLIIWAIATFGTSTSAPEWVLSILTFFAVVAAFIIPPIAEKRRQEAQERVAEIVIASILRSWLRIAAQEVDENIRFSGTGGQDGERKIDTPEFVISLERVAAMRPHLVKDVLSLLERRERRQNDIYWERNYGDDDDALTKYYEEIAHLFWSVRRIYREIARDRGLDELTNLPHELKAIKDAEEKVKEYREIAERYSDSGILADMDSSA